MNFTDEIKSLSFDQKIKVWLDYVVTISVLNNDKPIIDSLFFNDSPKFPALGCYLGTTHDIKPMSFDDFISSEKCIKKTDYGTQFGGSGIQTNYSGIYDWYPKFKNRIFKNK